LSDYVSDSDGDTATFSIQDENTSEVDCSIDSGETLMEYQDYNFSVQSAPQYSMSSSKTHFYLIESSNMTKYDSSGNLVISQDINSVDSQMYGIMHYNQTIYGIGNGGSGINVYEFSESLIYQNISYQVNVSDFNLGFGIYQKNNSFFILGYHTNDYIRFIFEYNNTWDYQNKKYDVASMHSGATIDAVFDWDDNWLILDKGNDLIYVHNSTFNYTGTSYNISNYTSTPQSMSSQGYLYLLGGGEDTVFRFGSGNSFINITPVSNWTGTASCTVGASDGIETSNNTFYITVSNIDPNVTLELDGVSSNRTYEHQTTANLSLTAQDFDSALCLDIDYPYYGDNFMCNSTSNFSYSFAITDPTKTEFSDGDTSSDYVFRHYGWKYDNITIDSAINITSISLGLTGSADDLIIDQFDDMTSTSKSYFINEHNGTIINLTFDQDITLVDARFVVSIVGSGSIDNVSVDMFNDGTEDFNYNGTIDQFNEQTVSLNETLINNNLSGSSDNTVTVQFNITANNATNVTLKSISFYKTSTSSPTDVKIDLGDDGANDIEFTGTISGSTLSVTTDTNGNASESVICNTTACNMTLYFNLSSSQTFSTCYIYVEGSGYGSTFSEDYDDASYINGTPSLSQDTFFGQVEMSGASGSYTNGELVSTLLRTMKDTQNTITLTATDQTDTGAEIKYYISMDNGTNWQRVYSETTATITNSGKYPRYKIIMTTNTGRTANAYVTALEITDIGDYPDNLSVDIGNDGSYEHNYSATTNTKFKITFDCDDVNDYIDSSCSGNICTLPIQLNYTGPGTLEASSFYFGGSLGDLTIDKDIAVKHQVNQRTSRTYVSGNETGSKNGTTIYNWFPMPGYSVANNDLFINVTGSYWR